jgi:hypothetical protein
MFGVIVVPRYTVMIQEREKLAPISLKSMSAFYCFLALTIKLSDLAIKAINFQLMLSQKALFQASLVDRIYN